MAGSGDKDEEQAFQPKWWNSSPLYGIVTVWTIWLYVGEPRFTSMTASASGFDEVAAEQRCIGEFLRRPFHRELRRRVKGRIRSHCHGVSFPICVEAELDRDF